MTALYFEGSIFALIIKAFQSGDLGFHFQWDENLHPKLDAYECFDIGRRAYLEEAPNKLVRDWMRVAEKIADPNIDEDLYIDIVDHLGFTSSKTGRVLDRLNRCWRRMMGTKILLTVSFLTN